MKIKSILSAAILCLTLWGCENEIPDTPAYTVVEKELDEQENSFRIKTPVKYTDTKMGLIARELKYQWSLQGQKQVYFFRTDFDEQPYGAVEYLPKCGTCGKHTDPDGEKYDVRFINS